MKMNEGHAPKLNKTTFTCPHCEVVSHHEWFSLSQLSSHLRARIPDFGFNHEGKVRLVFCLDEYMVSDLTTSICIACKSITVWKEDEKIYPRAYTFQKPNKEMSDSVKKLYEEAARVFQESPRASAALLRLSIETLCEQLGEKGSLNDMIGSLVKKGLSQEVQMALDYCRVTGNKALHPGEIDIDEDPEKVEVLFQLVNHIVEQMIAKPKEMKELYESIPEDKRKGIEHRDKK